jgi:hypothetical protein
MYGAKVFSSLLLREEREGLMDEYVNILGRPSNQAGASKTLETLAPIKWICTTFFL